MGTRAGTGLDPPLGEDLKVRDERAGHSRPGSVCRGELRPERTVACQGLPAGQSLVQEVEGPGWTDSSDLMLGLGSCSWTGGRAPAAEALWPGPGRWPGAASSPICSLLRGGRALEWKQMF